MNNYFIYLEDAPVDSGMVARGLSKALLPTLIAIDYKVRGYLIRRLKSTVPTRHMPQIVRRKSFEIKDNQRVSRLVWRIAALTRSKFILFSMVSILTDRFSLSFRMTGEEDCCLLAPIGIDAGSMVRAWVHAKRIGVPLHVYFVDDLETHPSNSKICNLNWLIAQVLEESAQIYTVTEELGKLFAARYRVSYKVLPLVSSNVFSGVRTDCKAKYFGVYLGSINHLYKDGLSILINEVEKLRNISNLNLKLRLISSPADAATLRDAALPAWIDCGTEKCDEKIRSDIRESMFCFLPYSFESTEKIMVSTSFPSKMLNYLTDARAIVVFAPAYSTAAKILNRFNLPFVVSTVKDLGVALSTILYEKPELSADYYGIVDKMYSPSAIRKILE